MATAKQKMSNFARASKDRLSGRRLIQPAEEKKKPKQKMPSSDTDPKNNEKPKTILDKFITYTSVIIKRLEDSNKRLDNDYEERKISIKKLLKENEKLKKDIKTS